MHDVVGSDLRSDIDRDPVFCWAGAGSRDLTRTPVSQRRIKEKKDVQVEIARDLKILIAVFGGIEARQYGWIWRGTKRHADAMPQVRRRSAGTKVRMGRQVVRLGCCDRNGHIAPSCGVTPPACGWLFRASRGRSPGIWTQRWFRRYAFKPA